MSEPIPTDALPAAHGGGQPSPWVQRWSHLVPASGTVLDVACGQGRHMQWFAQRGHAVLGIDRDARALSVASTYGETLLADIENAPWPLPQAPGSSDPRTFSAVVVTNYLWRPVMPSVVQSVGTGGVLIYETFAAGQETVGRPARAEFLLQPGELLQACAALHVVAYECGFLAGPDRFVQRIVAVRTQAAPDSGELPIRHSL